jgi:hypothetical protein
MITREMPDIKVKRKRRLNLSIPGGWEYYVPVVEADPKTYNIYSKSFLDERPGNFEWASEQVTDMIQHCFENEWRKRLRHSVSYWSTRYAKMFPHLVQKDGSLLGFRPEQIQSIFMPNDRTGKRGKLIGSQLLLEMANNVTTD